jgi:hypothetical protein
MRIDALKGRVAGANRPRWGSSGALPTGSRANGFGIASNYALRQRMQAPEGGQTLARARAGEYVSAVRHSSSKRTIGRNGSLLLWNRPVTTQNRAVVVSCEEAGRCKCTEPSCAVDARVANCQFEAEATATVRRQARLSQAIAWRRHPSDATRQNTASFSKFRDKRLGV